MTQNIQVGHIHVYVLGKQRNTTKIGILSLHAVVLPLSHNIATSRVFQTD
jgi:hypothetical protein